MTDILVFIFFLNAASRVYEAKNQATPKTTHASSKEAPSPIMTSHTEAEGGATGQVIIIGLR